ncbi:MAG: Multidrug export protein EmrB [Chlamydiia bacterium]|nr:Multidrug export protein EmrB [Chlamydiia bacterium]
MQAQPKSDSFLSGIHVVFLLVGTALSTFIYVLDYSIANVAVPYIAGGLAVSAEQGTYVITSFAVGNAIALPMTGWLSKRVGVVRLVMISILLFAIFSWCCGISSTILMLVISRFIQGFVVGPVIPISQSMIMQQLPPEKRTGAIAIWSMIVLVAPVAGPLVGGWICVNYTWPWIFFINLPICALAILFIYVSMHDRESAIEKEGFDWVGFFLLAVGVTCLQIFLDKGEQWDWFRSNLVRVLAATSFICLSYLTVWSIMIKKPLIELKLMKIRTFAVSTTVLFFSYSLYFGTVVVIPLWLQTYMGYNALWAGIAVAPIGFAPVALGFIMGRVVNWMGYIPSIFLAMFLISMSCFYTAYFNPQVDLYHIMISRFILGLGVTFWVTPLFAMSLSEVPPEKMPSGAGLFHFLRSLSGGIGTSIYTTIWVRRTVHHHLNLASDVTPYSALAAEYQTALNQIGLFGKKALTFFNNMVDQQASVLALNEDFYLMGFVALGLMFFVLIGIKRQKVANPPPKFHASD